MDLIVKDQFDIDYDALYLKSETGLEYWINSLAFYESVMDKNLACLSSKQVSWLKRLEEQLSND